MKKKIALFLILLQMVTAAGCTLPYADTGKDLTGDSTESSKAANTTTGDAITLESGGTSTSPSAIDGDGSNAAAVVDPKVGRIPVVLFYQDSDGFLIPVTRWIEKQQGIARAALSGLVDSALTREELQYYGLYPVLPLDTEIIGISIKEGIATVDFSKELLNLADKAGEKNMLASVVYTLTGFKTITGVKLLVNGYKQEVLKNGTDVSGVLTRERVMMNAPDSLVAADSYKADVFVLKKANDMYTYMAPVSVQITGDPAATGPTGLLEQLLHQTTGNGIDNEIPQGTKLLHAALDKGILTLDFSGELSSYGGNAREEAILKQILYTAGQVTGAAKVRILIDGQSTVLPEGTDLATPLNIPAAINDVIDNS